MDNELPKTGKKSSGIGANYTRFALRIVADFGATIAVPVVLFAWIGKRLDTKYDTAPWLLITGFVLAAVISVLSIRKKAKKLGKEFEKMN